MIKKIKLFKRNDKKQDKTSSAIVKVTNDSVTKARQEVIKKGQRFKYPVQYSQHKLVINAIIVAVVVAIGGLIGGWYSLYKLQNTSAFMYRVSLFLPLPVADVDGEKALYSDYLAQYRSNMSVTERQEGALPSKEDEERRSDYYKRQSMDNTIANTYAIKLAREHNISITDEEVEKVFAEHRQTSNAEISEVAFNKIIHDNYRLSPSEYRRMFIELPLLKQKVAEIIDTKAKELRDNVDADIKNGLSFEQVAEKYGDQVEVSSPGFVKSTNIDGGRAKVAFDLEPNRVSEPFVSKSGDGYYIVKLIEKQNDEVSYAYIKIPFTEFNNRLQSLRSSGNIREYIQVAEDELQTDLVR